MDGSAGPATPFGAAETVEAGIDVDEVDGEEDAGDEDEDFEVAGRDPVARVPVVDRGARGRALRCAGFSLVVTRIKSLPGTLSTARTPTV